MASSRAVDLAFRKQFRFMESAQRRQSRANMRRPVRLHESEEQTAYDSMLSAAVTFFEKKQDETVGLPPDSPEKLIIDAIMGVLKQFQSNNEQSNSDIRDKAQMLSEKLRGMFEGKKTSSDIGEYVNKLREGMSQLHNNISPGDEPDPESPDPAAGPAEPGKPAKPEAPPEPPPPSVGAEEEGNDIAKKLGL